MIFGPKVDLSRDPKKIPGIGASHIGHAPELAFSPKEAVVVKAGILVRWIALIATTPPFRRLLRAATTTSPLGAKVTARSSSTGGLSFIPLPTQVAPIDSASRR